MNTTLQPSDCRIALLAGGKSGERPISLASGEGARAALEAAGFAVDMLDTARKEDIKRLVDGPYDAAFICLHGRHGEDGAVQGLLELLGIPYIGSGIWASASAMNKSKAKLLYASAGIPTPPSVTVGSASEVSVDDVVAVVGEHCVVKAASEGSTLGIYVVERAGDLLPAIGQALEIDKDVVIEKFVAGREFTVVVLGNDSPEALPVIEIVPQSGFYDFEAKYTPGGSEHLCPAPIDDSLTQRMQELAVRAHRVLECSGVSRSDFIVDEAGDCWALETNTIPGMTETSLLPDAARVAGISFPDLCTRLVQLALERHSAQPCNSRSGL